MNHDDLMKSVETGLPPVSFSEPEGGMPLPLEMRGLLKYEGLIENLVTINNMNAPFYMREFLKAKELANSFYCRVMMDFELAKDRAAKAKAIAYLDTAPDWLEKRNRKVTDEGCKQYALIDTQYLKAREEEACLKALTEFLRNKMEKFQSAHDDAKKIYDQTRDPRGSLTGLASGKDAQ